MQNDIKATLPTPLHVYSSTEEQGEYYHDFYVSCIGLYTQVKLFVVGKYQFRVTPQLNINVNFQTHLISMKKT